MSAKDLLIEMVGGDQGLYHVYFSLGGQKLAESIASSPNGMCYKEALDEAQRLSRTSGLRLFLNPIDPPGLPNRTIFEPPKFDQESDRWSLVAESGSVSRFEKGTRVKMHYCPITKIWHEICAVEPR